jgi:hypothetical protein
MTILTDASHQWAGGTTSALDMIETSVLLWALMYFP